MLSDQILNMNVGEFLEKYEDDFDSALIDLTKLEIDAQDQSVLDNKMEQRSHAYSSPPKKEGKKIIIKKKQI